MTTNKDVTLPYLNTNPCFEENIYGLHLVWWNAGSRCEEEILATVIEKYGVMAGSADAANEDTFQACIGMALTGATAHGHIHIIKKLLDMNRSTVDPKYMDIACRWGRYNVVLCLLRYVYGAIPQPSNITRVVEGGWLHIVKYLVDIGVEPALEALEVASGLAHQDIFLFLSEKFPDLARTVDSTPKKEDTKSAGDSDTGSGKVVRDLEPSSRPLGYQSERNPDAVRKEPASRVRVRWFATWSTFLKKGKESLVDFLSGIEKKGL
ncbi:hypothetical protein AA313_de0200172 [Arthrobotrys entomopaga]|nr:hypothetical protein AA313_de0200172 [Arthrobotrys entomopaga]